MKTNRSLHMLLIFAMAFALSGSDLQGEDAGKEIVRPKVQIAILLDNSGSMKGLINQARTELWKIVNEFATAKQGDLIPTLEVALYHYGNPPAKQLVPLTDDLDKVSEALFGIQINGGSEYCGQAIDVSSGALKWSDSDRDLKLIFIAGNEPFSQGPVDYRKACKSAIEKGIIVNTIHCGDSIPEDWKEGALLADGKSININHNKAVVNIPAPQDKEIQQLGLELNKTYVAYGRRGRAGKLRQEQQDSKVAGASPMAAQQRIVAKAGRFYKNSSWDLSDAVKDNLIDLESIAVDELPENMRKMSLLERKDYVKELQTKRSKIQEKIKKLSAERNAFVENKRKEIAASSGDKTLDTALIEAIREQASVKQFTFGK